MRMTPANPCSKSQRYTEDTPPSKYLEQQQGGGGHRGGTPLVVVMETGGDSQVSVLIKGVVGFDLQLPQAG